MKHKIQIETNDKIVYSGRLIDIPIKEEVIIKKSIELFDDEDPCIIHKSYVIKEFADIILQLLRNNDNIVNTSDFLNELSFIDIPNIDACTIRLKE